MSDLSEIEQWEALKRWLRENGAYIVAGVAIGALLLTGWRWWNARADRIAVEAAGKYEQVMDAFNRNDRKAALARIDELKAEYPSSPYVDQANLSAARVMVENGELQPAADRLRAVMDNTDDRELALVARLRLARVQIALGKADDALATLANTDAGAFEPRFQEVRGDAYLAKGDKEAALREYRAARAVTGRQVVDTTMLDLKINDLLPASAAEKNSPSTASAGS